MNRDMGNAASNTDEQEEIVEITDEQVAVIRGRLDGDRNIYIQHPVLNGHSKHYDNGEKSAIEEMEEEMTIIELIGWCKANIKKYEYRKGRKAGETKRSNIRKRKTYMKYMNLLLSLVPDDNKDILFISPKDMYRKCGIHIDYRYLADQDVEPDREKANPDKYKEKDITSGTLKGARVDVIIVDNLEGLEKIIGGEEG